jgi:hypothetical protein
MENKVKVARQTAACGWEKMFKLVGVERTWHHTYACFEMKAGIFKFFKLVIIVYRSAFFGLYYYCTLGGNSVKISTSLLLLLLLVPVAQSTGSGASLFVQCGQFSSRSSHAQKMASFPEAKVEH